ncbi:MAG: helix-turn-helix transcriptional regulator, partial [Oscillospiraceae bacterium]|nr:helix-turn-helix transcriptional regulator [Oscillospiraceae bacterium]
MVIFMQEFHIRLRDVRMEKKRTQKQTAEVLGMNLRSYQLYEQGKVEPNIKKLIALA